MHTKKLLKKLAYLEFVNDQLEAELHYMDRLLRAIGFTNGLTTVKTAALELIEQEKKPALQEEE